MHAGVNAIDYHPPPTERGGAGFAFARVWKCANEAVRANLRAQFEV